MEVWNWGLVIYLKVKELPTDDQTQYPFLEFPFTVKPTSRRSSLPLSLDFSFSIFVSKGFPGGSAVKTLPAVQETWAPSLGWEDPLGKETATQHSVLAWEIPWTEEPGGLQSRGSQGLRRDWGTKNNSSNSCERAWPLLPLALSCVQRERSEWSPKSSHLPT